MVEPLLYAALGFLTASLVALLMGRALWNRAVRLTTHRIMRRLPLSRDEIVASRDLLRAEVAIEHRKLERQANLMRERMTRSMADVGRRDATIVSMRGTVEEARVKAADADVLRGGLGADFAGISQGADHVFLGEGDDEVKLADDGAVDTIRCGAGLDSVTYYGAIDPLDVLVDCEDVTLAR